ncbi:MAG: competence/damage-inducible protein A [Bdellovibrionaceae bacterium]|nr:competence/damage-inducible protein A [Pseudobdellovibrionaceae bacterium]
MIATVIGVGSELTSGQIMNTNGVWISKSLKQLGISTSAHLVVPDERVLIVDALKFCAERSDTIFVTGGLGPTTDDFTRELISEWSKQPLEFHEASWLHITERLGQRGIKIREAQRQQCMYPKGAIVISNPEGTANAFQMRVGEVDVFVLPGPPREIKACWQNGIESFVANKAKHIDKHVTYSWDTMGLGESDVSHITETCLTGVDVEKGYRVHMPYVEVKMSFLESQKSKFMPYVEKVDEALRSITITRDGEDLAQSLAERLKDIEKIQVIDLCTGAALLERMTSALKSQLNKKTWTFASEDFSPLGIQSEAVKMILKPLGTTGATAEIHHRRGIFTDNFEAPLFMSKLSDRKASYFAERAMIFWNQALERL